MKILITGSQGYIARNLAKKLVEKIIFATGLDVKWKRNDFKKWGYKKNVTGNINNKSLKKIQKY